MPPRYYTFYKDAIRSLSNDNILVEEINAQDKDEVLNKIFEAIDRGYPIILLSGGPWLYDATDFPDTFWSEYTRESSWPSGNHASVIVGYSLKEEMNNFLSFGPLTFLTNLLDYPPVIKIHDPATAASGVGIYWVSYSKLFEKTIGYPSVAKLLIVKPNSEANAGSEMEGSSPIVQTFQVTPLNLVLGESFAISYNISDSGGSGLNQVELWRMDNKSDWQQIKNDTLANGDGPISGSFTDSPSASGEYWYGLHVVDNTGNWNDEKNSNTNNPSDSNEPIKVDVKGPKVITTNTSRAELYRLDHNGWVYSVSFSPDGSKVAAANGDGTARIWDASTGTELHRLNHDYRVNSVSFSPDGNKVATASLDTTARIWDVSSGAELHTLDHDNEVVSASFSPDGNKVATISKMAANDDLRGCIARIWDVSSGAELHTLEHDVKLVSFSPDGNKVATANGAGTARIWDVSSGAELHRLNHYYQVNSITLCPVNSISFSPDGSKVATASSDHSARIWDASSGAELQKLDHDDEVGSVLFSPDSSKIATICRDGTARIWDVSS
ncbi:MAG: WD40 repeat domain-containing protein [Methanothrix sp.]|nr:WD40 repeat domain-containing protein [Methanothrix sp.]